MAAVVPYFVASCWSPYAHQLIWLIRTPPQICSQNLWYLKLHRATCLFTVRHGLNPAVYSTESGKKCILRTLVDSCHVTVGQTNNSNGSGLFADCSSHTDLQTCGYIYPRGTVIRFRTMPGRALLVTLPLLRRPDRGPLDSEYKTDPETGGRTLYLKTMTFPLT